MSPSHSASREINILHLMNGEQYSGLERVVDHLAEAAPKHGYRFHLVCLKPGDMPDLLNTREACIHRVPMRFRLDLTGILQIRRIALELGCRLIHSHTVRSAMIARVLRLILPLPWLHHVHSPARYESEDRRLNYINCRVEKRVLPKADRLLAVSEPLREYLRVQYRIPEEKIIVIRNGVEIVSDEPGRPRPRRGDVPTLGMVGLFRPRKGVETLLRALMLMSVEGIPFRLKLIGGFVNEAYHREVRSLVDRLGLSSRVEFTGFRRDVKDHLAVLDVFVMPSLYGEGVPMALLEAMAVGRVIVASQVDGISEILTEGACGILVSPGDAVALAKAIGKAITDPLCGARLSAAARTHQQSMYSVDTMVHRIFQVYRQCLLPQVGAW